LGNSASDLSLKFGDLTIQSADQTTLVETPLSSVPFEGGVLSLTAAAKQWLAFHVKLNEEATIGKNVGRKKIRRP
jgi:hypothetical protein